MTTIKTKLVRYTKLRRGSKVLHNGCIRTVEMIDMPNRHTSFPKITFDKGDINTVFPLSSFHRVSY